MDWKDAKSTSDMALDGITVEVERHDKTLESITLIDKTGKKLKITTTSYSLKAYVPQTPTKVKKWEVRGTVADIPFSQVYDEEYLANLKKSDVGSAAEVEVVPIEVEEIPF